MRKYTLVVFAVFLAMVMLPSLAWAGWKHDIAHEYGNSTSIKIQGTDGVTVEVDGKKDTIPTIINLDDQDAFVLITATAADGQTWSKKVEVKKFHQTVMNLTYTPDKKEEPVAKKEAPKKEEPKELRKYIGNIKSDSMDKCRFVLMLDGKEVSQVQFDGSNDQDVELTEGSYEVRVFGHDFMDGKWVFVATDKLNVNGDGWAYSRRDCSK